MNSNRESYLLLESPTGTDHPILKRIVLVLVLSLGLLITMFPYLWAYILSTHERDSMFSNTLRLFPGQSLSENYTILVEVLPFWTSIFNSLSVSITGTVVASLFCSMGGFAMALYEFRGKQVLFVVMIVSMMLPPVVSIVPYFMLIKELGLIDTHLALWLPFAALPYGIFLLRQYAGATISKEIVETARIDGANDFQIYWKIALPAMKPALVLFATMHFIFLWNNYLNPLVATGSPEVQLVTQALRSIQKIPKIPFGALMLGSLISMVPVIIVYIIGVRQIFSNIDNPPARS